MLYVEADGTGVPMRAAETEGRDGKDGQARTREIKLARLFTVSAMDAAGHPVTDPGSSSYVATFDGKDALAHLVEAEYLRRGGEHVRQVVAVGDGAAWIWTMAQALYPHATCITDIYHAREHLHDLASHLAFITPDPAQWLEDRLADLDAGDIEAIITAARHYPLDGIKASELDTKAGLLRAQRLPDALRPLPEARHVHRLRRHRSAASRPIVVQRAKLSGMHWTVHGAADIIALRSQHASGRWDELWPARPPARPGSGQPSDRHQPRPNGHSHQPDHLQQICRAPPGAGCETRM